MIPNAKLVRVELAVQLRDRGTVAFGVLFPALLLAGLASLFPGFQDLDPELGGRPIDLWAPTIVVFGLVMLGVSAVAANLAAYRTGGVLRRLRTTPVGAPRLLVAHLLGHLVIAVISVALAVTVAIVGYGVPAPASWPALAAGLALTAAALVSIGGVIGARVPSAEAANLTSSLVWLPVMALAGLWFPREAMPDLMRTISDWSPGGAAVEALSQAWFDGTTATASLALLAGTTLVLAALAAAIFRWD